MIFIGDIHGLFANLEKWIISNDIKDGTLIQVGDFGLGFQPIYRDVTSLNDLKNTLKKRNCTLYIMRGNHDNPKFWKTPTESEVINHLASSPERYLDYSPTITFVEDGCKYIIEDQTVLFVGGGISIDRMGRTEGVSYWVDEIIDKDIINNVSLESVDIICTHVPPIKLTKFGSPNESSLIRDWDIIEEGDLIADLEYEQELLETLVDRVKESKRNVLWVSGHMHTASYKRSDNIDVMVLAMLHNSRPNPLMTYVNNETHMNSYNLNGLDDIVGMKFKQE